VITSTVLLNGHIALGALFRVCGNPIGRFRIIITFFNPLAEKSALHWIVPLFATLKAKYMSAFAFDWTSVNILNLHGVATVRRWTPTKKAIALDKTVGDKLLVLGADARLCQ
jgi:hypothetical protein